MVKKKRSKEIVLLIVIALLAAVIIALLIVDVTIGRKEVFNFSNPLIIENWITMIAAIVLLVIALRAYLK